MYFLMIKLHVLLLTHIYRVSINVCLNVYITSMYVLMSTLHVLLLTHIYRVSINVCLNVYITCISPNPHL